MRERFGHYTLVKRLAVGGMAEIFLAEHAYAPADHARVVIKRILPQLSRDPSFVRMFIDEARLAVGLVHPNVVRTFDFGCVDGEHYLTMARVDGVDLQRLIGARPQQSSGLGVAASCALGLGLARGLAHAHGFVSADGTAQHIVHRDVSPHNVMVSRDGTPLLMDFGIAKAALRQAHTATGVGAIKGKLAYMAPEQARGEPATQHSDQYALGVVLYECLAGKRLFAQAPERRLAAQGAHNDVPPLATLAPWVPPSLATLVMQALAFEPTQRCVNVDTLARRLHALCEKIAGGATAAQQALANLVAEAMAAGQVGTDDWSWRQDLAGGGTRELPFSQASTPLPHSHRRIPRHRPHPLPPPRLPTADRRPLACSQRPPSSSRSRALPTKTLPRPRKRVLSSYALWWALCAAACGATGDLLWRQWPRQRPANLPVQPLQQDVTRSATCCTQTFHYTKSTASWSTCALDVESLPTVSFPAAVQSLPHM